MAQKQAQKMEQKVQSPILENEQTKMKPPPKRKENRPLTQEQVRKVMLEVDNLRDAAALHLGFNCGPRVSEVPSFNQDAIDWQQGQIKIWDEKKDIPRWIVPPLETLSKLKQYINESKPGNKPVFNISEKTLERIVQRWTKQALGFEISWHSCRTTYISISAENEVNPKVVSMNTGDSISTILRYYTKLSPGYMRKAMEKNPVYSEEKKVI